MRKAKTSKTYPPSPIGKAQIVALLGALSTRSNLGIRNRCILLVLSRTGLRISELLALKICCVDFDAATIRIERGKGQQADVVACDDAVLASISRWMDRRRLVLHIDDRLPIFVSPAGRPLTPNGVRELLKRLAKRAGLDGVRVTPHNFRHGFAHRLAAAGVPLSTISHALRHRSIETTFLYLRNSGLGNESVHALRRFDWD